jgi:hypothetical protein
MFQSLSRKRGRPAGSVSRNPKNKTLSDLIANTTEKDNGCMEWNGPFNGRGYGVVYIGGGRTEFAHRAAIILGGAEIPKGYYVCHKCDNPKCCNPDHLFVGTPADNLRDAQSKGRMPTKKPRVDRRRIAKHGMRSMYRKGCKCVLCTKAATEYIRSYRAKKTART